MSEDEFQAYRTRLVNFVYDFMARSEAEAGQNFTHALAHHCFLNPVVMKEVLERRRKEGKPDIPLAVFAHGTALKMFEHEVEGNNPEFPYRFHPLMKAERVFEGSDTVTCVFAISDQQVSLFSRIFPNFPKDRVVISPNGINQHIFKIDPSLTRDKVLPSFKVDVAIPSETADPLPGNPDYVVAFVGKFADWKRLDCVLRAAQGYEAWGEEQGKTVMTVVAGSGPDDARVLYHTMAKDLGLKNCYFIGPKSHPELAALYNAADVGVFPSWQEPFGLVFIECMACGTPTIGANSGGPKDFVKDSVGTLVPEAPSMQDKDKFIQDLTAAVITALRDNHKALKGPACSRLALDEYSLAKQCNDILHNMDRVFSGGASRKSSRLVDNLKEIAAMKKAGILSDEEFAKAKQKLLTPAGSSKENARQGGTEIVLGGDIGGTNSRLRLYRVESSHLSELCRGQAPGDLLFEKQYANQDIPTFNHVVKMFFADYEAHSGSQLVLPKVAAFAVAGPVDRNSVAFTNRSAWVIDGDALAKDLGIQSVRLVNDFVANGYGLLSLKESETVTLQDVPAKSGAPIGLIGAGTGLGVCFLTSSPENPDIYNAYPSEGGHTEFAPRTDLEIELLQFLKHKFGEGSRVSVERICSGKGISNVYEFLRSKFADKVNPEVDAEWQAAGDLQGRVVTQHGTKGDADKLCKLAMDIFFSTYGSHCGVVGLNYLCYGGLYIAGGIAPKNLEGLQKSTTLHGLDVGFMASYHDKGRVSKVLSQIPVKVVLAEDIGQRGAFILACRELAKI
eukprot:c39788_g1_i1.p1 GENE.c39788_g1_i1~~c39788_g1_i1.p1  ORF type:complete len:888 (+),score=215.31 c39788_g1_i1:301-2664(+)